VHSLPTTSAAVVEGHAIARGFTSAMGCDFVAPALRTWWLHALRSNPAVGKHVSGQLNGQLMTSGRITTALNKLKSRG